MGSENYQLSGFFIVSVIVLLIAIYIWSRMRSRRICVYSERTLRENHCIVLYSRGEGPIALGGLLFLSYAPTGLDKDIWSGIFAIAAGVFGLATWVRYALCTHRKPCVVMDYDRIHTLAYGAIPWSNVEEVKYVKFLVRMLVFERLVLKIKDFEKARHNCILPLRVFHKLNCSHEVLVKLSNMSLSGDEVAKYAKRAHRLTKSSTGGSR
jgi:hypothetical protein